MACWFISVALLLLLIGQVTAAPEPDPSLGDAHTAPCQEQHNKFNNRLDAVEKVEEIVQKLEAELAGLVNAIEAPELNVLLNNVHDGPAVDIFEESNGSQHS